MERNKTISILEGIRDGKITIKELKQLLTPPPPMMPWGVIEVCEMPIYTDYQHVYAQEPCGSIGGKEIHICIGKLGDSFDPQFKDLHPNRTYILKFTEPVVPAELELNFFLIFLQNNIESIIEINT